MADSPKIEPDADARIVAAIEAVAGLFTTALPIPAVDFADARAVLGVDDGGGVAVVGHGIASGPDRARKAAEAAITDLKGQLALLR